MDKNKISVNGIIYLIVISITVIVSIIILSNAFINRNKENEIINVTGLGAKDFESDLVTWSGSFTKLDMDLQNAYAKLNADRGIIIDFLKSYNVSDDEYVFSSVSIYKQYETVYDQDRNQKRIFIGYSLSQEIKIESGDLDKVENISREISELINKGVEFYSQSPQYFYTGLSELKMELIEAATKDAKQRAESIAQMSGFSLGRLKYANMGVFQIIAKNSNEDYSWDGAFNTSSRLKTATITMKLQFGIK